MSKPVLIVAVLTFLAAGTASPLDIVSQGQSRCHIELSPGENRQLEFAAAELQRYIERMSGAKAPVGALSEPSSKILLRLAPAPTTQAPATRQTDSFSVRADDRSLTIEGGSGRAVLYGVYEVLERMGCRFISIGPEGKKSRDVIPFPSLP